jgi:hypothetical protein
MHTKISEDSQFTFLFCITDHPDRNIAIIIAIAEIARMILEYNMHSALLTMGILLP